ncbi:DUF5694 domain-containing protein [Flavobacterium microcysteis]|uniref:TraB/GumN family protein n=1 Tax=Flavobacterium microcysteis TaxID=2596891 RepID=A0A501QD87_9FLAO|nr:DUF5694 domain-containing protein [Flavobacterium microcysteis]TPD69926.1 hypothetical protein FJA49_08445 [Flavobacterium microcysteis]
MKRIVLLMLLVASTGLMAQTKKKQILLVGSFHFENPGYDVAKVNTFDVMTPKSQKELETITNRIKKFGPDKIFVEWDHTKQDELDQFYAQTPDSLLKKMADERVQLALRTAKKLNHKKMYAIDYLDTTFPYNMLLLGMEQAGQTALIERSSKMMKDIETNTNKKIATYSLTDLILSLNTPEYANSDIQWYVGLANKAGKTDNFIGAFLVSEWYKRNLYMFSLVQKLTESQDSKVMVLLGAGHISMFREIVKYDPEFEIVELKDVLK